MQNTTAYFNEKKELRKTVKSALKNFWSSCTQAKRERLGTVLAEKVKALPVWEQANNVCVFLSMPDEIDTAALINDALQAGKGVFVPRIAGDDIEFVPISMDWQNWSRDGWNIPVPPEQLPVTAPEVFIEQTTLFIVPGLAFDKNSRRLGRGKGFYDRYLGALYDSSRRLKKPMPFLAGVGTDLQIVDTVPSDTHDMKMDTVIVVSCENV